MPQASPCRPKRIRPPPGARRGAVVVLLGLALVVVLTGVGALALNLAWLTSHQVRLRQACEAAALAGAAQLMDPAPGTSPSVPDEAAAMRVVAAVQQAQFFFAGNSNAVLETTGSNPDVVAGWSDNPTAPGAGILAWSGSGAVNSLLVRGALRRSHGQAVIMWFGSFFGVPNAEPTATATASMDQRICGFRPVQFVRVPMVPVLVHSTVTWPSTAPGAAAGLPDNFAVDPRTEVVAAGSDGIAEITLRVPLATEDPPSETIDASWISLAAGPMDFAVLAQQISLGLDSTDLATIDGQLALGQDGALSLPAADAASDPTQAAALQAALVGIRGQERVWPIGNLMTVDDHQSCRITGFVAGRVVDCSAEDDFLAITIQACTIQTCTGLLRSQTARNPWIGKLILNE